MSKYLKILVVWVLVAIVSAVFFRSELLSWSLKPNQLATNTEFDLDKGTSLNSLARELEELQLVDSSFKFKWLVKIFNDYSRFQAGHYLIEVW